MKGRTQRPFVVVTFAMTVDGKITTKSFTPVDFTSRQDKLHLFRQRALADAVLVGHTTVERDNVRLGLPAELRQERINRGKTPGPIRVIVSNEGRINSELRIFQTDISPVIIFSTSRMPAKVRSALGGKATLEISKSKQVDLAKMLRTLRSKYQVKKVACEGGPTLFRSLLERGLVDQLNLTIAPYMFGGAGAPTLTGLSTKFLPKSVHCRLTGMKVIGAECFLTYRIKNRG
jgi:riboflavin-specific deaminase-like protein